MRGRLVLLALAVLLPALAAAGFLLWSAYDTSRTALERQIGEQARTLGLVVDRQLGQDRVLIHALSATRSLQTGDWEQFQATATQAIPGLDTWVVVMDAAGRPLMSTRRPLSDPPPAGPLSTPAWSAPLPDGTQVSSVFAGSQPGVVATRRWVVLSDGRRVALAVVRRAATFDAMWREQKAPPTWTGVVLDHQMQVVSRSRGGSAWVGRSASPEMQARMRRLPGGVAPTRTLDGVESITGWSRSSRGGWFFIVAAPRSEIVGAATGPLAAAAISALLLMTAGVALAWWMGRRLALPVEALTAAARRLEVGDAPRLAPCGIAEIDALGEALSQSADRLARQQAELQHLNASLEARVAERSRELEAATESLVQAQKLEAVGRLTGGVAHDFNNLLMAISGSLGLMRRRLTDDRLLRYVDQARQAADRGAKLTSQLLAFSRKQRLQPQPTDVNAVALQARDLLASTLGGAVSVQADLDDTLWAAMADPTQLELVIMNLAINARDAMPSGGVVSIHTGNAVRTEPDPREEAPPPGEFVVLSVSDTGYGMSPEVEKRVFEPFFTTKEIGAGSGLGLPQVLGLAKQLGGGVELITGEGQGTTVRVFLPRAEGGLEPARPPRATPEIDLGSLSVLLVDDDPDVRSVARAMLSDLGCTVLEAVNGADAVAVAQGPAHIDAVLIDFAMPGPDGAESAKRICGLRPGLPVVMMSGFADTDLLAARWSGSILHKPFDSAALAAELSRASRQGQPTSKERV